MLRENKKTKFYHMKALTFTLLFFAFSSALFASEQKKTLKLRLQSPSGNTDETVLYFDEGITPIYNIHQDAAYIFSNLPGIPELYSLTADKHACSINGIGTLDTARSIYLGYHVGYPGTYTISASLIDNFDPTSIIRLIDNQTGDTLDLLENFYQVHLDSSDFTTNRFQILVSTAVQYSSVNSNCSNTGGSITISPDPTITWALCQLVDSNNNIVQTYTNVTGPLTFAGLAQGTYHVVYTYNQYTATNSFYLSGNFVVAGIGVPTQPIYTYRDVVFNALTTNASQFSWDFGDSTLINGVAHPTQQYFLPGTYTVSLYSANAAGCSASATATVVVLDGNPAGINETTKKEPIVYADAKQIYINMNGATLTDNPQVLVYNLLGQVVSSSKLNSQTQSLNLSNEANGYYLVSIRNAGATNTKRIFIAE